MDKLIYLVQVNGEPLKAFHNHVKAHEHIEIVKAELKKEGRVDLSNKVLFCTVPLT